MKIIALTKRYRRVIFFLLLLTCLDIPFPQLCGDEMKLFSTIESSKSYVSAVDDLATETILLQSQPTLPDRSSDSIPVEDDCCCFCCCMHILPTQSFNALQPDEVFSLPDFAPSNLPLSPLKGLFRPPRLA